MRVLIVEDETVAYENLKEIIAEIDPSIEVMGNTESICQTVEWLNANHAPDLIFVDIHLSDGSAFSIFEKISVETPIIFTTAYDQYAIEAFRVNSIDYLLKPIKKENMMRALDKFGKLSRADLLEYIRQVTRLSAIPKYQDKILVSVGDKLLPVNLREVSCFYSTDRNTQIYLKDGSCYSLSRSLEHISVSLDPADFIRANRQFILARDSVKKITVWFHSRLLIDIDADVPERIYVSKNKASEFKAWVVRENLPA